MICSYQSYAHEQQRAQSLKQYTNDNNMYDPTTTDIEQSNRLSLKQLRYSGQSYAHLLKPLSDSIQPYNPYYLDDPNLQTGKHRMVLNLSGYISSLVSYVRTNELKLELNQKFRSRHEWLEPTMSLSKIRSLKSNLLLIGQRLNLELSTIAITYIYIEKLILQNIMNKSNRKLLTAVCCVLALKYNEGVQHNSNDLNSNPSLPSSTTTFTSTRHTLQKFQRKHFKRTMKQIQSHASNSQLNKLFDVIYDIFNIKKSDILKNEFYVYKQLRFDLSASTNDIMPHFKSILLQCEYVDTQYLYVKWAL